jgi:photosystem II stability/assembly factor-like uncharacterized protein
VYRGQSVRVLATRDARTWRDVTPRHLLYDGVDDVAFADAKHGWIVTEDCARAKARLYRTVDGGLSWSSKPHRIFTHDCAAGAAASLDFITDRVGFAAVAQPTAPVEAFYRTDDGGTTWRSVSTRHWPPGARAVSNRLRRVARRSAPVPLARRRTLVAADEASHAAWA